MRKRKVWYWLVIWQQVTRVEWIVDELKDAEVLKNSFYCEFPALGRGAYDETEWFLWSIVKADIYRCSLFRNPSKHQYFNERNNLISVVPSLSSWHSPKLILILRLKTRTSTIRRIFEYCISYYQDANLLLNKPFSTVFSVEKPEPTTKGRSLFSK